MFNPEVKPDQTGNRVQQKQTKWAILPLPPNITRKTKCGGGTAKGCGQPLMDKNDSQLKLGVQETDWATMKFFHMECFFAAPITIPQRTEQFKEHDRLDNAIHQRLQEELAKYQFKTTQHKHAKAHNFWLDRLAQITDIPWYASLAEVLQHMPDKTYLLSADKPPRNPGGTGKEAKATKIFSAVASMDETYDVSLRLNKGGHPCLYETFRRGDRVRFYLDIDNDKEECLPPFPNWNTTERIRFFRPILLQFFQVMAGEWGMPRSLRDDELYFLKADSLNKQSFHVMAHIEIPDGLDALHTTIIPQLLKFMYKWGSQGSEHRKKSEYLADRIDSCVYQRDIQQWRCWQNAKYSNLQDPERYLRLDTSHPSSTPGGNNDKTTWKNLWVCTKEPPPLDGLQIKLPLEDQKKAMKRFIEMTYNPKRAKICKTPPPLPPPHWDKNLLQQLGANLDVHNQPPEGTKTEAIDRHLNWEQFKPAVYNALF